MKGRGHRGIISAVTLVVLALTCYAGRGRHRAQYGAVLDVDVVTVVQVSSDGVHWTGRDLEARRPLPEGARLQVNFRPRTPCFAYLVWSDADGRVEHLYLREPRSGAIEPGRVYTLPSPETWYTVNATNTAEKLRLVVSGRPLDGAALEAAGGCVTARRKGDPLALPLSDGTLHHTRWDRCLGKGVMSLVWEIAAQPSS